MSRFQYAMTVAILIAMICPAVCAQDVSDQCLTVWRSGELDSVKALLPVLYKKHASSTATRFFQAVFDQDGDAAVPVLESIASTADPYAEESLIRLVQYQHAKGLYVGSRTRFEELARRYPESRWIAAGRTLLASVDSTVTTVTDVSAASGRFSIQVGAFGVQNNAIDLQNKLTKQGLSPVTIQEKIVKGKTFFTVRVGSYVTRQDAETVSRQLRSQGLDNSIVEN